MIFYKHFIGDYQRKTNRLSILEDGVYRRLLDEYYANELPLPLEKDACFRLVRAIKLDERKAVLKILSIYFSETPEGYFQARACEQIAEFQKKSTSASRSARKRWNAVADANADANASAFASPVADAIQSQKPKPESKANKKSNHDPPQWAVNKMRKAISAAQRRLIGTRDLTPAQFRRQVEICCGEIGIDFYPATFDEAMKG